ncbi:LuxR family transcriptional regulator [Streptomyces sudanensis]|uniref:helix-turn-helix transcriptional regulator n=1 Tax=Streptomyces sudanensis TaxID=436397 RepID=UPI0020CD57AC|nr:LuxR family transcriptional regulator [Streptomyces sudanensis]MCP9985804.1 LuxR family transcriptional regulator [Streptomyces sudanensis]
MEEAAFPFGLVRQFFTDDEAVPFSVLTGPDEQRLFHGLTTRLARSAAERPVLLAVDDLHHADEPSRRWIGYLARRIAEIPVLLVATERADPSAPALLPPSTGVAVALSALSVSAVTRIARAAGLDQKDIATCVEASAGNPALVRALVADLGGEPFPHPSSAPSHVRYRDTIAGWLRRETDPFTRDAYPALAVLAEEGKPADPDLLRRLSGHRTSRRSPCGRSVRYLGELMSHPLAREAVLAAADPEDIAALHTRIAGLLDESGAPATAVASRLLRVDRPSEAWMTRSLAEAAEEAKRAGRVAESALYLRHALSAPLDPDLRADLTMRLGALELPNNAIAGIRRLHTGLGLHTDPRERATAAIALSAALVAGRESGIALWVLRQAGRTADDELVQVLQTLGAFVSSHDNDAWRGAVAGLRALAPTAHPAIEPLVCGLITEYEAGAGLCSAAEALARVRPRLTAPVDPRLRTAWLGSAATLLQWADCLEEARELTGLCLPAPPVPPDLTDVGLQRLLGVRAGAALWAGEFDRVIAENAPLVEATAGQGVRLPHLAAVVAAAERETGRRARAWEAVTRMGPPGGDNSREWNELGHTRALLHAADGDWQAALDDYMTCGAGQNAYDFVNPAVVPWRSGAALALVRLGRREEARELAEEELRHARTWGTARTVGRALRAYAAAVGGRLALSSLTEGAELLRPSSAPVELVELLVDLGRAHLGAGNGRKGRDTLREAHSVALRLAAPVPEAGAPAAAGRLLALTEDALRESGVRNRGDGHALTPAERRVAELAAVGHTNAQISSALCLTRRTVETHLTSAYRKLRIARRTQLVAALERWEPRA